MVFHLKVQLIGLIVKLREAEQWSGCGCGNGKVERAGKVGKVGKIKKNREKPLKKPKEKSKKPKRNQKERP